MSRGNYPWAKLFETSSVLKKKKKKTGENFCLPVFLTKGLGLCYFRDVCYLLQILQVFCCSAKYSALEGSCPLKARTVPAGGRHKWTRDSFLTPASHAPDPVSERPCFSTVPLIPEDQKVPGEGENRSRSDQHRRRVSDERLLT